jgi:hypothetical protein
MEYRVIIFRDSDNTEESSFGPYDLKQAERMEIALDSKVDHSRFTVRVVQIEREGE